MDPVVAKKLIMVGVELLATKKDDLLILIIAIILIPIMLFNGSFFTLFIPSIPDMADDTETISVDEYKEVTEPIEAAWSEVLIYDMVTNENDFTEVKPEYSAIRFLDITIKEYEKHKKKVKDKDGNVRTKIEYKLKDTVHKKGFSIIPYIKKNEGSRDDSIDEVMRSLESLDESKLYDVDIDYFNIKDDFIWDTLTEEQQEQAQTIIDTEIIESIYE